VEKHEAALAMSKKQSVAFGRERGATAIGLILKCNPTRAKVQLTAQFNSHPPGTVFTVPYSMLKAVEGGAVVEPAPKPMEFGVFMPPEDRCIMEAISHIYAQLEPERLFCDGERSRSEAARVAAHLQGKLKSLQSAIGHSVTEDDVYRWEQSLKKQRA